MCRQHRPSASEKRNTVPADQWIDKTFYILPAIYNDICLSVGDQVHGNFNIYTKDDLIDKFTEFQSYHTPDVQDVQEVILPLDSVVTRTSQIDDGNADPYSPGCRCTSSITLTTNHIKVLSKYYPIYSLKIFPLDYFKSWSYQNLQSLAYDDPDIQQLIKDRQLSMSVIDLFMEQYFNETGNEKDMIIVKDSYIIFTLWYRNNRTDHRPTLSEYTTHIDSKIGKSFPKSGQRFNSWLEWTLCHPADDSSGI
jgi:hypothetical protein